MNIHLWPGVVRTISGGSHDGFHLPGSYYLRPARQWVFVGKGNQWVRWCVVGSLGGGLLGNNHARMCVSKSEGYGSVFSFK